MIMDFNSTTSFEATIAVALLAVGAGLIYSLVVVGKRKKQQSHANVDAPPVPAARTGTNQCVMVLGAGTIGSSFSAVYLARGMEVVCVDPAVSRDKLEKRIQEYWPYLVARGIITTTQKPSEPPFGSLSMAKSLQEAMTTTTTKERISFVQECTWEEVEHKQKIMAELDDLLDPSILIVSSTSFITWQLLSSQCQHKHRIMIGHPAIPHTHSYMEIYGCVPKWVQHCKDWYEAAAFDVLVMKKTIPGHVFNSFVRLNMDHGLHLVRQGVCSVEDVNKAMRHIGRDMYARHFFVSLLCGIGGDRGVEGGMILARRIRKDAVFLVIFSALKEHQWPDLVARPVSKYLGRFVDTYLLPNAPDEFLRACERFEEDVTNGGQIPTTTALFNANSHIHRIIPMEVGKDQFHRKIN